MFVCVHFLLNSSFSSFFPIITDHRVVQVVILILSNATAYQCPDVAFAIPIRPYPSLFLHSLIHSVIQSFRRIASHSCRRYVRLFEYIFKYETTKPKHMKELRNNQSWPNLTHNWCLLYVYNIMLYFLI